TETDRRITQLFLLTMAPTMYKNLVKLASGNFGPFQMNDGLYRELLHLRDIGYVAFADIQKIPAQAPNLSDWVQATQQGRRFVELRKEMGIGSPEDSAGQDQPLSGLGTHAAQ